MPIPGCGPSCKCCTYFGLVVETYKPNGVVEREFASTGDPWCGWVGGFPTPTTKPSKVCQFKSRVVPFGLTIAISGRLVSRRQLATENLAHQDVTGSGSY